MATAALSASGALQAQDVSKIAGFDQTKTQIDPNRVWQPFSDKKVRVGIAGYGFCQFGAQFEFQNHPNVEVVAVTDLFPDRCAGLAKACRCKKQYPSLEEMIKDKSIDAVFLATDAPNHVNHVLKVLAAGKHVASAVPAVFGNLEDADRLFEAVKKNPGLVYALFETAAFRDNVYASRMIYQAGCFGKMIYTEGEYFHNFERPIGSYKGWRIGLPPQFYPTHSNGFYTCVTGGSFTEVSCFGHICRTIKEYLPENNVYKNPFGSETALLRTSEGGMARMMVSWDTQGPDGETTGQNRGELGAYLNDFSSNNPKIREKVNKLKNLKKPALPPGMNAGGHGGSHGYLCADFIDAILAGRKPVVDIIAALNISVAGIIAHQSALKDGELMKIPQYKI